jgi:hypothetical protein
VLATAELTSGRWISISALTYQRRVAHGLTDELVRWACLNGLARHQRRPWPGFRRRKLGIMESTVISTSLDIQKLKQELRPRAVLAEPKEYVSLAENGGQGQECSVEFPRKSPKPITAKPGHFRHSVPRLPVPRLAKKITPQVRAIDVNFTWLKGLQEGR